MALPDWMIERDIKIEPFVGFDKESQKGKISYGLTSYGYDARISSNFSAFSPVNSVEIDPKNFDVKSLVPVDIIGTDKKMEKHDWKEIRSGNMRTPALYKCNLCGEESHTPEATDRFLYCTPPSTGFIRVPPHSFVLGETVETFTIPRDVLCIVVGKSTYARCGLVINVTPGEPEWTGKWTVEMSNTTDLPIRVYVNEGIMQCIFLRTDGLREAGNVTLSKLIQNLAKYEMMPDDHADFLNMVDKHMEMIRGSECKVSYADKKGKYNHQKGLTLPKVGE